MKVRDVAYARLEACRDGRQGIGVVHTKPYHVWRFSLAIPLLLHHVSAKQKRRDIALTIPNLITIMRFLLVPAVVLAMLNMRWDWAFAGFLVAGISDGVDGFIARRFNQHSKLLSLIHI